MRVNTPDTAVLSVVLCALSCSHVFGGVLDNAPPILSFNRKWEVPDNQPVGNIVARVTALDPEGDTLVFGLEHHHDYNIGIPKDTRPLPFVIDNVTGVVRTNTSLKGRGGENLYLYVTVTDGSLTQKAGVWASILDSKAPQGAGGSIGFPGGGLGVPAPPGILPPGLSGFRPNYPLPPRPTAPPRPGPPSSPPSTSSTTSQPEEEEEDDEELIPTTLPTSPSTHPPSPSTSLPPATTAPAPTAASPATLIDLILTIVPITVICVSFTLAGMAACFFRKRICPHTKNTTKEDMQKKNSNGPAEEPMVMHHWSGPRAFSNRYEGWNPDSQPPNQNAPAVPIKSTDRWEFPRHHLKVFNILGEGCFGQVWKCEALNIDGKEGPTIVAVKTLKENAGERERSDLLQELQVMKMLEPHPNVVRLIGCCTEKDPLFVIMEYVQHGKLQSFLRNSRAQRSYDNMHGKSSSLTARHLTTFCYHVAKGMQFLSSRGIIHRDLAARNVLVGDNFTCKVADFGFARDVTANHVYERKTEGRLPIRWMAPESLYDNIFTVKSDIWSFGVLIWEIVTLGSTPYPGLSAPEVMKRVKDGYRLDKPEHCKRELYNIMYYCWDQNPKERPDFTELIDLLEQLLLSETDYIELQLFPDHSYYNIVSLSGEKL